MRSASWCENEPLRDDTRAHAAVRARHRARHVAPRPAARRPARPCRRARRPASAGACARLLREGAGGIGLPEALAAHRPSPGGVRAATWRTLLARALVDEPPLLRRDGGFVRAGCRADLDEARGLRDDSRKVMASLEARYLEATGIKSLKVRHNNILGFYVEVPAGAVQAAAERAACADLPASPDDGRRRAVHHGGADRDREPHRHLGGAGARPSSRRCSPSLRAAIAGQEQQLGELAAALAELDCEAGLAQLAAEQGYTRPALDDSTPSRFAAGVIPWWSRR